METYEKTKSYTLKDLIDIFCKERESLRQYFMERTTMYEVCGYFFDKWIEEARKCETEEEFDSLIRESLRMSFEDWFSGIK